jgi:hypothetical protein
MFPEFRKLGSVILDTAVDASAKLENFHFHVFENSPNVETFE